MKSQRVGLYGYEFFQMNSNDKCQNNEAKVDNNNIS